MNDQPEQQEPGKYDHLGLDELNAELDKLIQAQKAKDEAATGADKDHLGEPRLATIGISHSELHALATSVKMLFQFCSMALITGDNSKDESKEWKERIDTLLGLKEQLQDKHNSAYSSEPCDDDDNDHDNCDHDH